MGTLLLWSGGCDSTLILADALAARHDRLAQACQKCGPQQKDGVGGDDAVRTISINHPDVPAQAEQAKARTAIRRALTRKYGTWPHTEVTITHGTFVAPPPKKNGGGKTSKKPAPPGDPLCNGLTAAGQDGFDDAGFGGQAAGPNGGIVQPLIWLPTAILYLGGEESLTIGYIRGDDAQYYLTTMRQAFDSLQWIARRTGKLLTPLDVTTKAMVLDRLTHHGLLKHTWHCESPDYKIKLQLGLSRIAQEAASAGKGRPCGRCAPCKNHTTALWQIQTGNGVGLSACRPLTEKPVKTLAKPARKKKAPSPELDVLKELDADMHKLNGRPPKKAKAPVPTPHPRRD